MAEEHTPNVEDLLQRITKLEAVVADLVKHEHQLYLPDRYGMVAHKSTRPIGFGHHT